MARQYLEFEKSIAELELQIGSLENQSARTGVDFSSEIKKLSKKVAKLKKETFANLSSWQRTLLARHPERPYTLDYISYGFSDFIELHGDRKFADSKAVIGGFAKIDGYKVMVIGQQKGRTTKERTERNFGMPQPEGYRKALRLMRIAEKFSLPVINFIDTFGAYPGLGAEKRGQAEAIARNLCEMFTIKTPIISIIIGEGGSGGALALGVADYIMIMENAVYSVISPEGCASILWKDAKMMESAATALKITSKDLFALGVVDEIIKEPLGGAHRDPAISASILRRAIRRKIKELLQIPKDELLIQRRKKFRKMGVVV